MTESSTPSDNKSEKNAQTEELPEIESPILAVILKNIMTELLVGHGHIDERAANIKMLLDNWQDLNLPFFANLSALQFFISKLYYKAINVLPCHVFSEELPVIQDLRLQQLLPMNTDMGNSDADSGPTRPMSIDGCTFNIRMCINPEDLEQCYTAAKNWRYVINESHDVEVVNVLHCLCANSYPCFSVENQESTSTTGYSHLAAAIFNATRAEDEILPIYSKVRLNVGDSEHYIKSTDGIEEVQTDLDIKFNNIEDAVFDLNDKYLREVRYCFILHADMVRASESYSTGYIKEKIDGLPDIANIECFENMTNIHFKQRNCLETGFLEEDREFLENLINNHGVRDVLSSMEASQIALAKDECITELKQALDYQLAQTV